MQPRANGVGMLVASSLIIALALALVLLAGPFGHTRLMSHEPVPRWPAAAPDAG